MNTVTVPHHLSTLWGQFLLLSHMVPGNSCIQLRPLVCTASFSLYATNGRYLSTRTPTSASSVCYNQCAIVVPISFSRGLRTSSRRKTGGGLWLSVQRLKNACSIQLVTVALLCQTRQLQRGQSHTGSQFPELQRRVSWLHCSGPEGGIASIIQQ